jgi:hypothetical protein
VVLLDPDEPEIEQLIDWLTNRFRYRNVGVPPTLVEKAGDLLKDYLKGNPFVELAYPVESLRELAGFIARDLHMDPIVPEALVLASSYASPMITLGRAFREPVESLSVGLVSSKIDLDSKSWRLHLRIADYTVLDFYQWSSEHAQLLWQPNPPLDKVVKERRSRIEKDKRRYWRLQRGEAEPKPFLLYLDLTCSIAELALSGNKSLLDKLVKLPKGEASAGLAIVSAVLVLREE